MNASVLLITIAISVPFLWRFFIKKYRFRKLINKIPGPDGQFIFGSAIELLKCPMDKRMEFIEAYFKKYGDLFRLWLGLQPQVGIGNAEDAQVILTSNVNIDKSMVYKIAESWIGTGLITSTGKKWAERRKLLTPAFHFATLNSFFGTIVENCNALLEKLKTEENSEEFDVYPYVNNCSLDIICETAMGIKAKAQEGGSDYISALKKFGEVILDRFFSPWLWLDWVYIFSSLYKKQQNLIEIIHGFSIKVIEEKKNEQRNEYSHEPNKTEEKGVCSQIDILDKVSGKKPFLNLLLDISNERGGFFSNADLIEETNTFMFAGHDTVAAASAWAIFLIGIHSDVQENIFQELYSVFGDSERNPTMDDIRQLKYLDMVLKESLRLYPSVPLISRDLTEDITLGGYKVPAGATVQISINQIHRNAKYYEKPNEFYPEHFSPENSSGRHPYAFIPFSAGPRNCIGQRFAMLEEKLLISSLLRRYKIKAQQKFEDISRVLELVLRPGNGVKIKISKRSSL